MIIVRQRGRQRGSLGPFETAQEATQQARVLADAAPWGREVTIDVEPAPAPKRKTARVVGRTPGTAPRVTPLSAQVAKPGRSRAYRGHTILARMGDYFVQPYGHRFQTLREARAWIDEHINRESSR